MTTEERLKASKDQTERFLFSYFINWRLAKILINEKILKEKYTFLSDIALKVKPPETENPESLIAQELTNGLEFDLLANAVQYIEDLFALLKAGSKKEFFIKEIITYSAGQVENLIKEEIDEKRLCELFLFPYFDKFDNKEVEKAIKDGIRRLKENITFIQDFYKTYQFHYNQYKHGLTIALRPYKIYNEEQIENDKCGNNILYLVAIDNLSIDKVYKNKKRFQDYIMMPCLTINTQPYISELNKEDNLIRFVMSPPGTSVEKFKKCAFIVRDCMYIFINNLRGVFNETDKLKLQLPSDGNFVYQFDFPVEKK